MCVCLSLRVCVCVCESTRLLPLAFSYAQIEMVAKWEREREGYVG